MKFRNDKTKWTYTLMSDPVVGKTYYAYDDGKLKPSREFEITITKALNVDTDELPLIYQDRFEIEESLLDIIKSEVTDCDWLYAAEQTMIYYGKCTEDPHKNQWFIRALDGGWFGMNSVDSWYDSRLDVDGSLYKIAHQYDKTMMG